MPEQQHDENGNLLPELVDMIRPMVGTTVGPALHQMGASSLFNLESALMAMHRSGVSGQLIIDVPSKVDGRYEVDWIPARNCRIVK